MSKPRKFVLPILLLLCGLTCYVPAHAQTWQPSGTMLGPLMWDRPVTLPDGTHLIGLRWVNARNNDSLYWYDIRSLLQTPERYKLQTPTAKYLRDVQDYNGNGHPDIQVSDWNGDELLVFDAFTTDANVRIDDGVGQRWPSPFTNCRAVLDIDGDSVDDEIHWSDARMETVRCQYGDRVAPFRRWSDVPINDPKTPENLPEMRVVMLGKLQGRVCILRRRFQLRDYIAYELLELSAEDLRERRDTIRTTLRSRKFAPADYYGSVVLRSDSVWWAFNNVEPELYGTALRITPDSITVVPVDNFWRGSYPAFIGQRGADVDHNWPRVMEADRPIIKLRMDSTRVEPAGSVPHRVFDLVRVTDPSTASVEFIGTAFPRPDHLNRGGVMNMTVLPDIDGDQSPDLMITWSFNDSTTDERQQAVNVYLTSQRPVVSVPPSATETDTADYRVVDMGSAWRMLGAASCLATAPAAVSLIDVRGAAIGTAMPEPQGSDILLRKPHTVPTGALFVRVGTCTIRLQ